MSGDGIGFNLAIGSGGRRPWVDYVPGFSDYPPPYYPGYGHGYGYNDNQGYNGGYWDYDVTTNPLNILASLPPLGDNNYRRNPRPTSSAEPSISGTQPGATGQPSSVSNPSAATLSSEEVRAQRDRARRLINGGSADGSGATFADQITQAINASRTREKELRVEAQKAVDKKAKELNGGDSHADEPDNTYTLGSHKGDKSRFWLALEGAGSSVLDWFSKRDEKGERHFDIGRTATTIGVGLAAAAICATGPVGVVIVAGIGLALGGLSIKNGIDKSYKAKTKEEAEDAYREIGTGTLAAALSILPLGGKGVSAAIGRVRGFRNSTNVARTTVEAMRATDSPKPVEPPKAAEPPKPADTPAAPVTPKPVKGTELDGILSKIEHSKTSHERLEHIEAARAYAAEHPEFAWILPELAKMEAATPQPTVFGSSLRYAGRMTKAGFQQVGKHPLATASAVNTVSTGVAQATQEAIEAQHAQEKAQIAAAGKALTDEADKQAKAALDDLKQLADAWGVKSDEIKKILDNDKLKNNEKQDKIKELTIAAQTKLNNDFQLLYDEPMPASINSAAEAQAAIKAKKDKYIALAAKVGLLTKDDMTLEEIVDAGKKAQDKLQADEDARRKNVATHWLN